ncbi:MAG: TetR family transcriptional regulator [Firmicutes bacterium]|nr:TetR family transcriptional regulator [Bacillota bacterium]
MAIDIKMIICNSFLELCETKAIEKITVRDILEKTGVSRNAFYNHFADKNALIHHIYRFIIIPQWSCRADDTEKVNEWNLELFANIKKYRKFMKGACMSYEPDSLRSYILSTIRESNANWFMRIAEKEVSEDVRECINYHLNASSYIIIEWILADMKLPEEKLCRLIRLNRLIVLKMLKHEEPYDDFL